MLARQNRLKDKFAFERIKKEGKLWQSESFALVTLRRGDDEPSRFGFVISTKISKDASKRNRVKRVLSEATRHLVAYIKDGFDCLFLAKQIVLRKYADELVGEVQESLRDAGLLK